MERRKYMKLNEIILEATRHDLDGTDADSILALAWEKNINTHGFIGWRKAVLIAAAVFLFAVSVSAAALLSGFGEAFDRPVDTGHVKVLSAATDNEEVTWNITETWFDEYNLHIGGTVITPEPLDPAGDHRVMCCFKLQGDTEYRPVTGYIFPSGDKESAFIVSGGTAENGDGTFTRTGFEEDEITLELKFCLLHDYALVPQIDDQSYFIEDYVTFPGEWNYTVLLRSSDSAVSLNRRYESQAADSSNAVVTSIMLNSFTLEITGENLTYTYNTTGGPAETSLGVWLRMKDGTLLGKSRGVFANTENRVEYSKETSEYMILCFEQPVDPEEVEAVVFHADWATFPASAEDYLTKQGWELYPSDEGEGRLESWIRVMEIPVA